MNTTASASASVNSSSSTAAAGAADAFATVRLRPGQAYRTAVDAGAWLQVAEGRVRLLEPPSWLAGTVFSAGAELGEGMGHRLGRAGWIEVAALTPARVLIGPAGPA